MHAIDVAKDNINNQIFTFAFPGLVKSPKNANSDMIKPSELHNKCENILKNVLTRPSLLFFLILYYVFLVGSGPFFISSLI